MTTRKAALNEFNRMIEADIGDVHNSCMTEDAIETVRTALTQAAKPVEEVWQDISTAPRDGWILGINARGSAPHIPMVMRSTFVKGGEFNSCAGEACWKERLADWPCYPTHWMPLPRPPETKE